MRLLPQGSLRSPGGVPPGYQRVLFPVETPERQNLQRSDLIFGGPLRHSYDIEFLDITCTPMSSKLTHNFRFPPATTCGEVRCCIESGIREVTSALHYTRDAAHYLSFYCPGDHQGPDPREGHPSEINFHSKAFEFLACQCGQHAFHPCITECRME